MTSIGARFGCAVLPVHARVLPLNRKGAVVADIVQRPHYRLEIDPAASNRAKIPVAAVVAKFGVAAKDTRLFASVRPAHVLHMNMEDSIGEFPDESNVIHPLVAEVTGVVVKAESLMAIESVDCILGTKDVECNLGWVDFQAEFHAILAKDIQNGSPQFRKERQALFQKIGRVWRKGIDQIPKSANR